MSNVSEQLNWFCQSAAEPRRCLEEWLDNGGKAVGCLPYYAPEELVWAAGFLPMAVWGAGLTAYQSKAWFPPHICSLAHTSLELAVRGGYRGLSAVICSPLCDTLRALSQNWRAAVTEIPMLTYTQPQNRDTPYGRELLRSEYRSLYRKLCEISLEQESESALQDSIRIYNASRRERRRFIAFAAQHGALIRTSARCAVLKAAGFRDPETYTARLRELNDALAALPAERNDRIPVVTSGILCDHLKLLELLDDYGYTIVGDDMAAESRAIAGEVPEDWEDGCAALAERFAMLRNDTLLSACGCTKMPAGAGREAALAELAQRTGAAAVLLIQQQFCDPEELLAPAAKQALEQAGIPCLILPVDQQTANSGQSATLLETLADILR